MSCLGSIVKLILIGLALAAMFVAGIFVVATFDVMTSGDDDTDTQELRTGGSESQVAVAPAPTPTPPPPPPSLEQRIESAQEALKNLQLGAQQVLDAAVNSAEPDAALREVTLSLETITDGANGANSVAKQLSEAMSEIKNKMQSIRANTYLSKNDKNDLLKILAAQQISAQKTLGQARKFCDQLRSIQTKDIPSWTSTYSHFVTVLGSSEALKKIAPRIKAAASKLGPTQ